MLPANKRKTADKFVIEKDDFRVSTESSGSNSSLGFKIRHRKKIGASLRLYD